MKFHFFANDLGLINEKKFSDMVSYWNDCGYESFLQVYNTNLPDPFILSARTLNKNEKIKFMIALRTISLSPEYCARQVSAFNNIQPNRLILNFLHGHLTPGEHFHGIIDPTSITKQREKIIQHSENFLKILGSQDLYVDSRTESIISGSSRATFMIAKKYADTLATDYQSLERVLSYGPLNKKLMVTFDVVILNNKSECDEYSQLHRERLWNVLVKTEEGLLQELHNMAELGVTDFLFSCHPPDTNKNRVHDFVKKNQ